MVQPIDHGTVTNAGLQELCLMTHQLASNFPSNATPTTNELIVVALGKLDHHLKTGGDHDLVHTTLPLDLILRFLASSDDLVISATCVLLNTWIRPWSSTALLENMDLILLGLHHDLTSVRILILENLRKLSPEQWTHELAGSALNSIQHDSSSVFDAFTSLLSTSEYATAILIPANSQSIIRSALIPHRVYVFRGLELIGRVARLMPGLPHVMADASGLFYSTYTQRISKSELDYAVFCEFVCSLLSLETGIPGDPANVLEFLVDLGVINDIMHQTSSNNHPECGIEPLLMAVSVSPNLAAVPKILDITSTLVASEDPVCVYTTLRKLSSFPSAQLILTHAKLMGALTDTFHHQTGTAMLFNACLQFINSMAPLSEELLSRIVPPYLPESQFVQCWISHAIRAVKHSDHTVQTIGLDALVTVATLPWAFQGLLRPDRLNFLMDLDENIELRQAKCAVVKQLLLHQHVFDNPATLRMLNEFVRRGPFTSVPNAHVQVDQPVV